MSRSGILKSSLAKKYWMAATGLFLCVFLLGHLAGNLQLFLGGIEGKTAFNEYAQFMTSNPAVKILSWVTYLSILFHALDGAVLVMQNIKARPKNYAYNKPGASSKWASRKMALLGTVVLAFIVVHMQNFWYQMHFGAVPMQELGPDGALEMPLKDLHKVVLDFFNPHINEYALVMVIIYVVAQLAISFHLSHGFKSAFQSLGLNHPKYNGIIKLAGYLFSIVVPLAFAIIPIYLFIYHQH